METQIGSDDGLGCYFFRRVWLPDRKCTRAFDGSGDRMILIPITRKQRLNTYKGTSN